MLITLWFIWKARNDYHFHRKSWTPLQVHNAANALWEWTNGDQPMLLDEPPQQHNQQPVTLQQTTIINPNINQGTHLQPDVVDTSTQHDTIGINLPCKRCPC